MQTIYAACHSADPLGGKEWIPFAHFTARLDAAKAANEGKSLGRVVELSLYESFVEYQQDQDNKLRQSALRKLTPDERRALGLT